MTTNSHLGLIEDMLTTAPVDGLRVLHDITPAYSGHTGQALRLVFRGKAVVISERPPLDNRRGIWWKLRCEDGDVYTGVRAPVAIACPPEDALIYALRFLGVIPTDQSPEETHHEQD